MFDFGHITAGERADSPQLCTSDKGCREILTDLNGTASVFFDWTLLTPASSRCCGPRGRCRERWEERVGVGGPRSLTAAIVMETRPPPRYCLAPCQVYYKHRASRSALSNGARAQSELQSREGNRRDGHRDWKLGGSGKQLDYYQEKQLRDCEI